jgi:cytochrome c-type biogenesis protein CcmH
VIAFALAAAAMLAIAVAWILVPLLRRGADGDVDRGASNLAVLRDQLRELEADRARGALTEGHYAQAREELERRVLEESAASEARAAAPGAPWAGALCAGLIPVVAVLLYLVLGTPAALLPQAATQGGDAASAHDFSREEVERMVANLAEKLAKEPDNVNGWVILARSYYVLKRYDQSAEAYERLLQLVPNDADLLADYADTLGVVHGGNLSGKPLELVKRALALDPTQWKALALAGTEAFNRKDYKTAVDYWEKLKATAAPDLPIMASIDSSIAEARAQGGLQPAAGKAPTIASAPAAPASPPAAMAAAGAKVAGTVKLSPALAAKASPDDSVFVFARAAEGSRMPLAILRKQVKDLPFEFALDDSMAMAPNMNLSSAPQVVVGARISRSGSPMPQSGDLQGLSQPTKVGATGVAVVIDSALP